ncbi:MAG: putative membrane protein YgcG, partial [Myxococcota bacterium]
PDPERVVSDARDSSWAEWTARCICDMMLYGGMMLCFLFPVALPLQIPAFSPETRVITTPSGALPTAQVSAAVAGTEHRVFVLVFEEVADAQLDPEWSSETEEALEEVWASWTLSDGFDAREDVLIVMSLDEREVRVRAGSRWDAALGMHTEDLGELIDDHFLPTARTGDLDGALAALAVGIDEEIDQRLQWRVLRSRLPWLPLPLAAVGGAGWWALRRRKAQAAFESEASAWAERLGDAEETLASFTMDVELRNQLIELRRDGPETDAACRRLAELIEEIRAGLAGMRRRQDEARQVGRRGRWAEATRLLSAPIEIDTGEHRLFDDPARTVSIDPAAFMDDLEARYQEARALWSRLEQAVGLSLQPIEAVVSAERLTEVVAMLREEGLGEAWLSPHPLFPDPSVGLEELAALRSDPHRFIDVWEAFQAAESDYLEDVEALLSQLKAHRGRRAQPQSLPESRDPEAEQLSALQERAAQLDTQIDKMTHEAVSVEAFTLATEEAREVAAQRTALQSYIAASFEKAAAGIALADAHVLAIRGQHDAAREQLTARAEDLSEQEEAALEQELTEAHEDILQMAAALAAAKQQHTRQQPLTCLRTLQAVQQEHREAHEDLEQFGAALDVMVASRASAEQLSSRLDAERARHVDRLAAAGLSKDALLTGDRTRRTLEEDTSLSWKERHERLSRTLREWDRATTDRINLKVNPPPKPRTDAELLQDMRRKEILSFLTFGIADYVKDVRKMRFALRNSGQFADTSSSSASHTRSRHSSPIGSSFSSIHSHSSHSSRSSSASAGRSFGSSSRSGGRSFSGGGRSGGRKF